MSQENVNVALAVLDAWNRGDREAFMSAWDEQAEFVPLRAQLESQGASFRSRPRPLPPPGSRVTRRRA
jgi:hypothetical protein